MDPNASKRIRTHSDVAKGGRSPPAKFVCKRIRFFRRLAKCFQIHENLFQKAKNQRGVTGDIFLQLLESRLDSVIYRLGFAKSRSAARQFVGHGHIVVNGKKTDISSFIVKEGDEIEVRERSSSRQLATRSMEESQARTVPS